MAPAPGDRLITQQATKKANQVCSDMFGGIFLRKA
jgi:hypothetical protein